MKATTVSKAEQMNLCRCMAEDYALNGRTPDKYVKQEIGRN